MSNKFMNATALAALCAATAMSMLPARAQAQDGMVVVRDPQTGELRAPTAAEARALRAAPQAAARQQAPVQHQATVGKGGSRAVHLGEQGMVYEVVTRHSDGKLDQRCVQGEPAAEAAVHQPASGKEARHESE